MLNDISIAINELNQVYVNGSENVFHMANAMMTLNKMFADIQKQETEVEKKEDEVSDSE